MIEIEIHVNTEQDPELLSNTVRGRGWRQRLCLWRASQVVHAHIMYKTVDAQYPSGTWDACSGYNWGHMQGRMAEGAELSDLGTTRGFECRVNEFGSHNKQMAEPGHKILQST